MAELVSSDALEDEHGDAQQRLPRSSVQERSLFAVHWYMAPGHFGWLYRDQRPVMSSCFMRRVLSTSKETPVVQLRMSRNGRFLEVLERISKLFGAVSDCSSGLRMHGSAVYESLFGDPGMAIRSSVPRVCVAGFKPLDDFSRHI